MVDETKKGAERILQATIDVLLTNGLQAATTRQVTEQAGVGRGLLNHYYNWQELRVLAWEVIFEEVIHDQFAQFTAADQAIEYYLASAFTTDAPIYWKLWLEATDLAIHDQVMAQALEKVQQRMLTHLTESLTKGHAQGLWRLPDASATALRLSALYDGLVGLLLSGATRLTAEEAEKHLRQQFSLETAQLT